jgi:Right handed beta helix region
MRYTSWCASLMGVALLLILSAGGAHAQATRTWVSGVGDDANPCSRTAPCKTFAGAISKTATGGEINVLDPGGFGAVTITKSITISSENFEAGVLVAGTNGVIVNAAGSNVVLRGLDFEGIGTGINGVEILAASAVHIEKCTIHGFTTNGILVAPSSGLTKVFVSDSSIRENGSSVSNAGILVRPTGGASANVFVGNTQLKDNKNGIFADGSGGAGPSNVSVNNSALTGSAFNGLAVASSGGAFVATITNSTMSFNAGVGAAAALANATLRIGGSTIVSNVTGVSGASGATVQSFKNNMIAGNLTDGTPITAVPGYSSGTGQ